MIHWDHVDLMNWTWLPGAHRATVAGSVGLMQSDVMRTWNQSDSVRYWSTNQSWKQAQSAWVKSSTTQWFLKTCAVANQKSEDLDDRCIRLIELFGGYSVSEELQSRCMELHGTCKGCRAHAWSFMSHAKIFLSYWEGVLKIATRNSESGIHKHHSLILVKNNHLN